MIKFQENGHVYSSINDSDTKWLSITTLIKSLHEEFLAEEQAPKSAKNKKSKWYGMSTEEILQAWKNEGTRSTELGTWYHKKRENDLKEIAIQCPEIDGIKYAISQKLEGGKCYPEFIVYLQSSKICGQVDYIGTYNSKLYIKDYKTSKEITRKGFEGYNGVKKMLAPIEHLDDCHLTHYALQLSLYAYIILRHNPQLILGSLVIEHIKFEVESEDKYGYPIYKKDSNGDFIVKEIEEIEVPYLKKEIGVILNWLKKK